tara:strand:- start:1495 stop:2667 length:1173 start_codon:yes stop_codon:yes gene_type:complete
MRYLSADIIFPINSEPIKNGVILINDSGEILELFLNDNHLPPSQIEYFKGALCPGFINTHCHLELSHLKNQLKEHTHIDGFVKELQSKRDATDETIQTAIENADLEMIKNGIVAVGDISNGNSTFKTKAKSQIHYHTFIELFGFNPTQAQDVYDRAKLLKEELKELKLNSSIAPHSPYSVSDELFKLIREGHDYKNPICIHNQENIDENTFYQTGEGRLAEMLKSFGISLDHWESEYPSSLQGYLKKLPLDSPILFVHNTFTSKEDLEIAMESFKSSYWCFCPNANQYIENTLPNIPLFLEKGAKCTIGTDSLASNYSLSVLDELKVIATEFPQIDSATLLKWASLNGAEFLGLSHQLGSFEKGKTPGINWLKNIDHNHIRLETSIEKII